MEKEILNYCVKLGEELGKQIVKKGGKLKNDYDYLCKRITYIDIETKIEEFLNLFINAQIPASRMTEFCFEEEYKQDRNKIISLTLSSAMKPIENTK